MTADDDAKRALQISLQCQEFLTGQGPDVQSAVLADLTSLWLAGHLIFGEDKKIHREHTDEMRDHLLAEFIRVVRKLVPASEVALLRRFHARRSPQEH